MLRIRPDEDVRDLQDGVESTGLCMESTYHALANCALAQPITTTSDFLARTDNGAWLGSIDVKVPSHAHTSNVCSKRFTYVQQ